MLSDFVDGCYRISGRLASDTVVDSRRNMQLDIGVDTLRYRILHKYDIVERDTTVAEFARWAKERVK